MIYHTARGMKADSGPDQSRFRGHRTGRRTVCLRSGEADFDWQGTLQKDTMSMAADILGVLLPDFQDMKGLVRASLPENSPAMT